MTDVLNELNISPILDLNTFVATTGASHTVSILDLETGAVRFEMESDSNGFQLLRHEARELIQTGVRHPGSLVFHDMSSHSIVRRFRGSAGAVYAVCRISPDLIASSSRDTTVSIWSIKWHERVSLLEQHCGRVFALCYAQPLHWIASGSDDKSCCLWDVNTSTLVKKLDGKSPFASLSFDGERRLLWTCQEDVVRSFSIRSFQPVVEWKLPHRTRAMSIYPDDNLVVLGDFQGVVTMWDFRNIAEPIYSIKNHDLAIWHIHRLAKGAGSRCVWLTASDDCTSKLWDLESVKWCFKTDAPQYDSIFLGEDEATTSSSSQVTLEEKIQTLKDALNRKFSRNDSEDVVRVFRSLLVSSPLVDDTSCGKTTFLELAVEEVEVPLLQVLFGSSPDPSCLGSLFRVFSKFGLSRHAYVCCKELQGITSPRMLYQLASDYFREETHDSLDESDWNELEIRQLEMPILDAFAESLIRQIKLIEPQIKKSLDLLKRFAFKTPFVFLSQDNPIWFRCCEDHQDFSSLKVPLPTSFSSILDETCAELLETRKCANVVLATSDGGEEKAHIEILVCRCDFFYRMMRFQGSEFASFEMNASIPVEEFTQAELSALLAWIYVRRLPETCTGDPRVLLRLAVFGTMFADPLLVRKVQRETVILLNEKTPSEVCQICLTSGWLLTSLPERLCEWFAGLCGKKLDPEIVERLIEHSCKVHEDVRRLEDEISKLRVGAKKNE